MRRQLYSAGLCDRISPVKRVGAWVWRRTGLHWLGTRWRQLGVDTGLLRGHVAQGQRSVTLTLWMGAASLRVEPEPRKNTRLGKRKRRCGEFRSRGLVRVDAGRRSHGIADQWPLADHGRVRSRASRETRG